MGASDIAPPVAVSCVINVIFIIYVLCKLLKFDHFSQLTVPTNVSIFLYDGNSHFSSNLLPCKSLHMALCL